MKKWMRSRNDRILAGVLGGLSGVFGMEAKILRIIFIILFLLTGFFPMGVLYLILVFIMPNEQEMSK